MKPVASCRKNLVLLGLTVAPGLMAVPSSPGLSAQDILLTGTPEGLYSIGAAEGEDWELLFNVRQVAFDQNDNLYILDAGNHRVLFIDANGRFVRQVGGRGGGHGEFLQPIGLAITADSLLVIADAGRYAHSVFDLDGVHIQNIHWDREMGSPAWGEEGSTETTLLPHPQGGVVMRTNLRIGPPTASDSESSGGGASSLVLYRIDAAEVRLFEIPQPGPYPAWISPSHVAFSAFTPPSLWGVLPSGSVVAAWEPQYSIRVACRPGEVDRVIQRPITPRKVTERDRERARELRRAVLDTGDRSAPAKPGSENAAMQSLRSMIEQAIQDMTFQEVIPVLAELYTDPLGMLWVQRSGTQVGQVGPIDLIRPEVSPSRAVEATEGSPAIPCSG